MKLQGRKLTNGTRGDDVRLLHHELRLLGFRLIPDNETHPGIFGPHTLVAVREFQKKAGLKVTGIVDEATAKAINEAVDTPPDDGDDKDKRFVVRGRVTGADGRPALSLKVRAFDRDLRSETLLGETTTDSGGRYEIRYSQSQFAQKEKSGADLAVKVFNTADRLLYEPGLDDILFNAPAEAVVDIRLPTGTTRIISEFEQLSSTIPPLLDGVRLVDLREDEKTRDLSFLQRESGWPVRKLAHFVVAHRLSERSGIAPEIFYALLAEDVLLKIDLSSASVARFDINLQTEMEPLFFDIVLFDPQETRTAVGRAVAKATVPAETAGLVDAALAELARHRPEAEAWVRDQRARQIFAAVEKDLAAGKHEKVLEILQEDALGDLPGLVDRLRKAFAPDGGEGGEDNGQASTILALGEILGFDEQILETTRKLQGIEKPEDVRKLAALNRAGWQDLLSRSAAKIRVGGAPLNEELAGFHASSLVRKMERRYPTEAFAAQLEREEQGAIPGGDRLHRFLRDHPDFDLARTNAQTFLRTGKVAEGIEEVRESLKPVQRVFKLAPTYRKTGALLNAGLRSAADIAVLSETQFVDRFGGTDAFTVEEAKETFHKAADVHLAAALLAGELRTATAAMDVAALSNGAAAAKIEAVAADFPDLKSLFQLIDTCQCEHCRSVYSPAAYLVDALEFLKNRTVTDTTVPVSVKAAKDVLFARRPDLGDLDLSCANTNTPLPHIDVVCELLEEAVKPDSGFAFAGALAAGAIPDKISAPLLALLQSKKLPFTDKAVVTAADKAGNHIVRDERAVCKAIPTDLGDWTLKRLRQTHLTAAELAAVPEYLNEKAYETLRESKLAFGLPFDLHHQESAGYFEQMDLRRASLMRALQHGAPADHEIAADALGLSDEERKLIVTPAAGFQNEYWNTGSTPAQDVLKVVAIFLTKTGLDYAGLEELLRGKFVNPGGAIFIQHLDDSCDTEKKLLENLDAAALDRIHRFLRLSKRTGWKAATLDRALLAPRIGNGNLDDACLVRLGDLMALQAALGLPLEELYTFYGELPTEGENRRYAQVFLNKAANGVVDPAFEPANVRKNELDEQTTPGSGVKLATFKLYLALCLGARQEDSDKLVDSLPPPAILSLTNLAVVYSLHRLARMLGLAAGELLILRDLTEIDVLANPGQTLVFVEQVRKARTGGIPPADLRYLLRHEADNLDDRTFGDDAITAWLTGLRDGYQAAFLENRSPFDAQRTADENKGHVRDLLAKLPGFTETDLSKFETLLDDRYQAPPATPAAFIDAKLGAFVDTTSIKAKQAALSGAAAPKENERKALIEAVLSALSGYFFEQAKTALLAGTVEKTFKLSEPATAAILRHGHLKKPPAGSHLLTSDALIDMVGDPPAPPAAHPAAFPNQYRAARLLHKLAFLISALRLEPGDFDWMLQNNASLGWMELDHIPYESAITAVAWNQWEQLLDALSLFKAYPPVQDPADPNRTLTLKAILETTLLPGVQLNDVARPLAALAGWDEMVFRDLAQLFGFSASGLAAFRLPATWRRLETAVTLIRRLGTNVATAKQLVKATLTADDVSALRQALKARYSDSQWLDVSQTLQDRLRVGKRGALVAYLLADNPSLKSANDLYDHFLIDVEMEPCMPTSRIVQAHGTLQLFVQRCLMGLEPKAVANVKVDPLWEQWTWMRNYRVWEANRKVFLYPENWIEPDLRDDKSFLFRNLEDTLLQNEINDRTVEEATIAYLEGLDGLAFLEVMAIHHQADVKTLHVFARTKGGDPPVYYYRRFEKERYWTPWEKVELDITGNHLIAFVRNSRLNLAWPVFSEQPDETQSIKIPSTDSIPASGQEAERTKKRWFVQLAMSELAGKQWLPKKVSQEGLYTDYYELLPQKEDFRFIISDFGTAGYVVFCTFQDSGRWSLQREPTNAILYLGSFALTGCKGYPEPALEPTPNPWDDSTLYFLPIFLDTALKDLRFKELGQDKTESLAWYTIFNFTEQNILRSTPGIFRVTYPHQMSLIDLLLFLGMTYLYSALTSHRTYYFPLGTFMPFFYEDGNRGYVIVPGWYGDDEKKIRKTFSDVLKLVEDILALTLKYLVKLIQDPAHDLTKLLTQLVRDTEYIRINEELRVYGELDYGLKFQNFYHPLVCRLRTTLYKDGIPALMSRDTQLANTGFNFLQVYQPDPLVSHVSLPVPTEDIDFAPDGSYSHYNWELFFHLPFLMAVKLSRDQRFEEARTWFHYIFNPIGASEGIIPNKYWVTKPFFLQSSADYLAQRIDQIILSLAKDPSGATVTELKFAVEEWRAKPFRPHVIARSRRVAYQKAVLIKYIQNLVDWGDSLFRQDTRESINEATQLYILADKLLGPKPRVVPPAVPVPTETYNQLEARLDLFGNALLELEDLIPDLGLLPHGGAELPPSPLTLSSLYFCIPPNDKMLEIWDLVADRLFKIRHCQNIEGIERVLALFAPPIDPGALVRAAAAGLSLADILGGLNAPLPLYRFNVLLQKANEVCNDVRALGGALLAALEKKDAEALGLLRQGQEIRLLEAVKAVRGKQIEEAKENVEGLRRSRTTVEERRNFYRDVEKVSGWEAASMVAHGLGIASEIVATVLNATAGGAHLAPKLTFGAAGFGGSPVATTDYGGENVGESSFNWAAFFSGLGGTFHSGANLTSTQASNERRWDDWKLQERLAERELAQIDKSIAAAELRIAIAEKEFENHVLQSENAKATNAFMRSKYTNEELYQWQVGQISDVYFQSYKLAYDLAKRAERCFRFELGLQDSSYISFGYWDSLKKGLLSGERLQYDLRRLETAYLEQNRREYEITKHVSLVQLDPLALVQLKTTGECTFNLPEVAFDLDHPGHYMRRIKAVGLSIPCVVGPYASVSCKLSLVSNRYRKSTARRQGAATPKDEYLEQPGNDDRFVYNVGALQAIATSQAQNDSGMFELNFRDERFLPFEGAGAISTWNLEMPDKFRQFDYNSITDVILQIRYTSRDGGSNFRGLAEDVLRQLLNETLHATGGLFQAFSLRHQFPNDWHRLKQDHNAELTIRAEHLPFYVQDHGPAVAGTTWLARGKELPDPYTMTLNGTNFALSKDDDLRLNKGDSAAITLDSAFTLEAANTDALQDLVLLVKYTLAS